MTLTAAEASDIKANWAAATAGGATEFIIELYTQLFTKHPEHMELFSKFKGRPVAEAVASAEMKAFAAKFAAQFAAFVGACDDCAKMTALGSTLTEEHKSRGLSADAISKVLCFMGGEVMAKVGDANKDAWKKLMEFFETQLKASV